MSKKKKPNRKHQSKHAGQNANQNRLKIVQKPDGTHAITGLDITDMLQLLKPEQLTELQNSIAKSSPNFRLGNLTRDITSQKPRIVNIANQDISRNIQRVINRFPNLSTQELSTIYAKQFREYNLELAARGLALSRDEIRKLDTIDLRNIGTATENAHDIPELSITDETSNEMTLYIRDKQSGFYRVLPCFSEGILHVNDERYIYFKIEHIDFKAKRYRVTLRDYAHLQMSDGQLWQPGIYGTLEVTNDETMDEYEILTTEENCFLFSEIYRQISMKALGWNKIQKTAWKEIAIANADDTAAKLKSAGTNNVIQLGRLFLRYITLSNFILDNNRPKIAPGQKDKLEHNKNISNKSKAGHKKNPDSQEKQNPNPEDIPEKIVRNVGLIRMTSARPPKVFSSESVRNYKIPSWTARGHTRHYKSGKTVYIQPTVRHRKAMKNPDGKIPQSVINIINNATTLKTPE